MFKHFPPTHPFFLGLTLLKIFSTSSTKTVQGWHRGWCQFITHCLCHSFLLIGRTLQTLPLLQDETPPMGENPQKTSPDWVTGWSSSWTSPPQISSTGCSSSGTDCSSVGYPMGSQVLTANLLQCGVLHRLCQEPTSVWFPWGQAFFRCIYLLQHEVLQRLLHWGPPWGPVWLTMVFTTDCKKALLWCLKHFLPLLFNWPWCVKGHFLHDLIPFSS